MFGFPSDARTLEQVPAVVQVRHTAFLHDIAAVRLQTGASCHSRWQHLWHGSLCWGNLTHPVSPGLLPVMAPSIIVKPTRQAFDIENQRVSGDEQQTGPWQVVPALLQALRTMLSLRAQRARLPSQLAAMLDRGLLKLAKSVTQIQETHPWCVDRLHQGTAGVIVRGRAQVGYSVSGSEAD